MNIVLLAILGIGIELLSSITNIASGVFFTDLVAKEELEKYNGTKSVIDNGALFIAPMAGTFLYGMIGIESVIVCIICFYLAGAIGVKLVAYPPNADIDKKTHKAPVLKQLGEGLKFVRSDQPIFAFFILTTALNFFVASSDEIINPGILIYKYAIPKEFFGLSSTCNIAGIILASVFIVKKRNILYQKHLRELFITNSMIMIAIGVTSVLLFGRTKYIYYVVFLILQILLGFVTILINVPLNAYFQANVPRDYLGRFFSFLTFAATLSIPFGISYTGFLSQSIGADYAYIVNNLCVIVIVILVYKNFDVLGKNNS